MEQRIFGLDPSLGVLGDWGGCPGAQARRPQPAPASRRHLLPSLRAVTGSTEAWAVQVGSGARAQSGVSRLASAAPT
jgi:hypothetical protein